MKASPARRQVGAALLALVGVVMIGGVWFLLYALQPANRVVLDREHNAKMLREAKLAVLGWVVQNAMDPADWNPGKLPCPEALGNFTIPPSANEGTIQGFCGGASAAVGRIPWKTLGIDKPYDASGEVLWYVVAPGWKRANNTTPEAALGINSNSIGVFTVDGVTPATAGANAPVAAIIAPGRRLVTAPLASQTAQGCAAQSQFRTTFPPADSLHYLECQNLAGAALRTGVADNGTNEAFNDQVIVITAADVLDAIEPVVARRITRDVVAKLTTDYVTGATSWGASAAEPYFPFPVSYPSAATFDSSASDYKGTLATSQGLLPMTATTCNALTAGRCDAAFIAWVTASITANCTAGCALPNIFTQDCAASTTTEVVCDLTFLAPLCFLCFQGANVTVSVTGSNVARAVRTLNAAAATGLTTLTTPLQADGNTTASYTGMLEPQNMLGIPGLCGALIGVLCSASATVRIPITVFQESLVNPATTDAWYWFTANNWHRVTYFAVASPNRPGGARNCAATSTCLDVTFDVGTSLTTKRAVLALAGRSVNSTIGSSRTISDFLDTATNIDFNSTFQQKRVSRGGVTGTLNAKGTFNDRFINVTP